ncbi:unnamed protein product [Adineta steineri]|uniref:NAD(P)(+)--arginine ADP-ribosyltransferase n=1 Tax=Adineta steineri TaxID=433720 RepID=A0A819N3K3_9BILA|nr:unnamed protein product [Adineta steineri]
MSESGSNQEASSSSSSNAFMNSNNTTTISSDVIQPQRRMVRNYSLIWLDECMDETNKVFQNKLAQSQTITDNVKVFKQRDECIDFVSDTQSIKSFLILENTMAQQIMPLINDIPELDSVYIFSNIKSLHEEWTTEWRKIKSVHTNIEDLCKALQLDIKKCNRDSIAMSFVTVNDMESTDNLNQLEPTFMYTQIFKENLLNMEHNQQAIKEFITYCRNNDCGSKIIIDRFEKQYHPESAIWWYTSTPFIYCMLNDSLRFMEGSTIINMGFFIHDLHQQIQQLHQQQLNNYHYQSFIVYRGQGLSKANFEKLQKNKSSLIAFNNFLSTSMEQSVSLAFARSASETAGMVGVLFKMLIDPRVRSVPFASIKAISCFEDEDEILFSMHTVFRVGAIEQIENENQLYQVKLQLTSDDDGQLRLLTDRIREEADGSTGWKRLGKLLLKIGQPNKAEELYSTLLEQTSDESEKAIYYIPLGLAHSDQGNYEKAIWYYEQGLEICQKTLPSNHLNFAALYNNIGLAYDDMGEYSKALSSHEKTLEIQQKTLPSNHPDFAASYNNIGGVYRSMREYSKALSFFEKALEIKQKTLPSNHPSLAASYGNIGLVYNNMGEYSKALSFDEKALEIQQKTLPSNHPSLATSYNNIGLVYRSMEEYSKALSFYEKALEIKQKILHSNHPSLATSYNNIGNVYSKMEEYSKALSFYEQALEIQQNTLPSNHPSLAASCNNIGLVYNNMGEYSKALSSHEKALEIWQKTLPSNHPNFAVSYNNIGGVYYNMKDYPKTLSYFERTLDIWQRALPPTHPHIINVKENIETVKKNL